MQGVEVTTRPVRCWSEPQTLWAFLHITLGIVEHLETIVPLIDDFMGEGATSHIVPTVAIVNFLHHFSSFFWSETSQIHVGVELEIGFLI